MKAVHGGRCPSCLFSPHEDKSLFKSRCPLFQDDDLEEGEVKDPSDRKVRPRPTCRFFMKGNCLSEGPLRGPFVWPRLFLGLRWWFSPGPVQGSSQGRQRRSVAAAAVHRCQLWAFRGRSNASLGGEPACSFHPGMPGPSA